MKYNGGLIQTCAVCGKYIHLARHSYVKTLRGQHVQYLHLKVCYRMAQNANHKLSTLQVVFYET